MGEKKKIIIVGGGIAGLSAGIYGQLNGFDTTIIEKNPEVGGLCTGWNRKGFYIDGCIHWLTGTNENTYLCKDWKTIGAFSSQDDLIYLPSWGSFEYKGTTVTFWSDLDKAENEWLEISPQDEKQIIWFFSTIRKMNSYELPLIAPSLLLPLGDLTKCGIYFTKMVRRLGFSFFSSCEDFAKKLKSPALRWAITHVQPGDGNLYSMMFSYATVAGRNGGIPKGGSLAMSLRIKERYLSLGGNLLTNTSVKSINIASNKAVGVSLENNRDLSADYIITACDAAYVINELIHNEDVSPKIKKKHYKPKEFPAPSCVFLNFLVEDMPTINVPLAFPVKPFNVGGRTIDHITIRHMNYDTIYRKGNKSVVQVMLDQYSENYEYWQTLYKNKEEYEIKKKELSNIVINYIVNRFPELNNKIQVLDVATPITYNRYVNAARGNYMGYLFTKKKMPLMYSGKAKGIDNLFLSGQYVQCPGGLPLALSSGKFSIQWILLKERNQNTLLKTRNISKYTKTN